jgi:selenocysteine lyase/cysteine desulfurase
VADAGAYLLHDNAHDGGAFATWHATVELLGRAREAAADLLGSQAEEIVVTALDHDVNIAPWLLAAGASAA